MVYGALNGFMHNIFWQDIAPSQDPQAARPSSDIDSQSKLSAPVDRGESFNPFKVNISFAFVPLSILHCIELNSPRTYVIQ